MISRKDKGRICRMAGNIVGSLIAGDSDRRQALSTRLTAGEIQDYSYLAVQLAEAIEANVEQSIEDNES